MTVEVTLALVFAATAVLLGIVPVLQWRGKLPPGNPNLVTQRSYLFLPHTAGLLVWALAVLSGEVLGGGLMAALFAVGLIMMFAGIVLFLWAPQGLRPRWQKEYMAEMGYDRPPSGRRTAGRRSRGRS